MSLAFDIVQSKITAYLDLMERHPDLFPMREHVVTDPDLLMGYARSSGRDVGLVYESPWHYLIVDVLAGDDGQPLYSYERYVSCAAHTGGVALPVTSDGRICLLRNYRHTMGRETFELPRGHALESEAGQAAAVRELTEETGWAPVSHRVLGTVIADSGVSGDEVSVVLIEIASPDGGVNVGHEGITGMKVVSVEEFDEMIVAGQITDGFTLSAIALWKATR